MPGSLLIGVWLPCVHTPWLAVTTTHGVKSTDNQASSDSTLISITGISDIFRLR